MAKSSIYIAGVGCTSHGRNDIKQISAATKALTDAGITFDDISYGVKGDGISPGAFEAFDDRGSIKIESTKSGGELGAGIKAIAAGQAQAVLVIANDKKKVVSLVVATEDFIWRHPYLKDSSVTISSKRSSKSGQADLHQLCKAIWQLRGWMKGASDGRQSVGHFELQTASAKVPAWKDIEHRQDGKFRLGHNPGTDEKDICAEDFEAVRAWRPEQSKMPDLQMKRKGGDRAALAKL